MKKNNFDSKITMPKLDGEYLIEKMDRISVIQIKIIQDNC